MLLRYSVCLLSVAMLYIFERPACVWRCVCTPAVAGVNCVFINAQFMLLVG